MSVSASAVSWRGAREGSGGVDALRERTTERRVCETGEAVCAEEGAEARSMPATAPGLAGDSAAGGLGLRFRGVERRGEGAAALRAAEDDQLRRGGEGAIGAR